MCMFSLQSRQEVSLLLLSLLLLILRSKRKEMFAFQSMSRFVKTRTKSNADMPHDPYHGQ